MGTIRVIGGSKNPEFEQQVVKEVPVETVVVVGGKYIWKNENSTYVVEVTAKVGKRNPTYICDVVEIHTPETSEFLPSGYTIYCKKSGLDSIPEVL